MVVNVKAFAGQIGARVREARSDAGLSIEQIARSLSIPTEEFVAAERGDIRFTASQIVDLCDLLDRLPGWFFEQLISASISPVATKARLEFDT